ncbi:uncharacterized protein LOC119689697 [Teleopsis dalmanni]|uniref:uncharacterized protein LOC119689697 n=1 Tax=Teleopsis dalmanni TaxID=139649 RepID=UPI0018CF5AA8|nr:uncharacterized protein LOC119689697 [Teleopsis dalmanni]
MSKEISKMRLPKKSFSDSFILVNSKKTGMANVYPTINTSETPKKDNDACSSVQLHKNICGDGLNTCSSIYEYDEESDVLDKLIISKLMVFQIQIKNLIKLSKKIEKGILRMEAMQCNESST